MSTIVNQRKVSPFAFALQKKWTEEKVKSKIVIRTAIANKANGYDLSIEPLLNFFTKIKVNQETAWKLILSLLKPETLVVIDWDLNLNRACNKKKIKLFYLQHGVIVADHMYFGERALKDLPVRDLPYGFLCWNDDSAQNFVQLCKTFITGNQWNNAFLNKEFLEEFKNEEVASNLNTADQPVILFTLTWGSHQKTKFYHRRTSEDIVKIIQCLAFTIDIVKYTSAYHH
ncbi:MAG: hypothetical protein IPL54_01425 [Chitinophagaceae bacterium]|nr:hypothetical protein [Chitinophagaceae bacterium]